MQSRIFNVIWCGLLAVYILAGIPLVPFHGDEATLIFMGSDFYYHAQGNTPEIYYQEWDNLTGDEATEQQLRLANGTVNKYLYGAISYLNDYQFADINQQWQWGSGWDWNHTNGHVPSEGLLYLGRVVSSILLIVSAIAIFGIGHVLWGDLVVYFASAYYVLNPAILLNGRRAMMESGMLAFTLLAVWMALLVLKHRAWWQYLLLGIFSGLAVASKHTSAVTIFAIFVACAGYFVVTNLKQPNHLFRPMINLVVSGLMSLLVFFALNPAWWSNPIAAGQTVLELRQDLLSGQVGFFGGYENFQEQANGFVNQALIVFPMHVENDYDGFYTRQLERIQTYDSSLLSGVSLGGSTVGAILIVALMCIGLFVLWRNDTSSASIMTIWLVAMLVLTLFITPLEWQRYYIPIYPVIALLGALGLDYIVVIIKQWQTKPTTA